MKKIILFLFSAFLLFQANAFADSEADVKFNSIKMDFDQPAIISQNRTLVPMRKIFEYLGAEVKWDNDTRTVYSEKDGKTVTVSIGSNIMIVDGKEIEIDVPAKIVNNRTLVPLRAVSSAYGCDVSWNASERTAYIYEQEYLNIEKKHYDNGVWAFDYLDGSKLSESNGMITVSSGKCILTLSAEPDGDVVIDDSYIESFGKGLDKFSSMSDKSIKKIAGKNMLELSCKNKGKSIFFLYEYKNGHSYKTALTFPDDANVKDAQRLGYIIDSLKK